MNFHVDINNLWQHDYDNSFLFQDGTEWQIDHWKNLHKGCVPIGFCDEEKDGDDEDFPLIAFVFEDERGNRYFTHVPVEWKEWFKDEL